jgi:hypothetical protein
MSQEPSQPEPMQEEQMQREQMHPEPMNPESMHRDQMHPDQMPQMRMMMDDEMETEPGPPVPPGEPAIPINHTTLAGLLLEWPPIRELTKQHVEREGLRYVSEFPISQEQNRGALIVYGRGEDSHQSRHNRDNTDHGSLDMADDTSDAPSPSPAPDFGHMGAGASPSESVEYKGGVLAADGNPDFSESKIWQYVESFKENILNMHPIVQPKVLNYWVRHFLDNLPLANPKQGGPTPKPATAKPSFAINNGAQTPTESAGTKRKRTPVPGESNPESPASPPPLRMGRPARSIHSALVLTILALGKICMHRDNIPDVVHNTPDPQPYGSPALRNGILPSPGNSSPPSYSSHSNQGTPKDQQHERSSQSRRPSFHGSNSVRSGYQLKKNYDVIPGLEYFAFAADILGNYTGAYNNIKNVYANIFASLYQGQLARPMESFAYIHKANHKLMVILRP